MFLTGKPDVLGRVIMTNGYEVRPSNAVGERDLKATINQPSHPRGGPLKRTLGTLVALALLTSSGAAAADDPIASAMSAAPASISAQATIMDWNFKVLRKGTNGWTCLPDRSDTPGTDPWCIDEPWLNFLKA